MIPWRAVPVVDIGPLRLRPFGLFVALGVGLGIWLARRFLARAGYDPEPLGHLALLLVAFGVVGARVVIVVAEAGEFVRRPWAVGKHLGGPTSFPFATRYLGGRTVEGPLEVGVSVHNTAVYEAVGLIALLLVLVSVRRRVVPPGVITAVVACWYNLQRLATDGFRAYDERFVRMTTAQFASVALVTTGLWLAWRLRRSQDRPAPSMPGVT